MPTLGVAELADIRTLVRGVDCSGQDAIPVDLHLGGGRGIAPDTPRGSIVLELKLVVHPVEQRVPGLGELWRSGRGTPPAEVGDSAQPVRRNPSTTAAAARWRSIDKDPSEKGNCDDANSITFLRRQANTIESAPQALLPQSPSFCVKSKSLLLRALGYITDVVRSKMPQLRSAVK